MKKYLVTGGTGFIGRTIVKRLVEKGYEVRVLDNDLRGAAENLDNQKIEIIQADIRNAEAVRKACSGMDGVIHLAYLNGTEFFYTKPELVLDIGVKGIVNVIDSCIKENVSELYLASSSEVYHNPEKIPTDETALLVIPDVLNPRHSYAAGKIISEMMLINYGRKHFKKAIVFRPHNVYGPNMGWEHVIPQFIVRMKEFSLKEVQFPIQGTGKETRAFIFIDDFGEGFMKVLEKGEHLGIYNIGTMDEITIETVAKEVGKYFGKEVTVVPGEPVKGSPSRRCPDTAKLKNLGFKAETSLIEGIRLTAQWYDKNIHKKPKLSKEEGKLYDSH